MPDKPSYSYSEMLQNIDSSTNTRLVPRKLFSRNKEFYSAPQLAESIKRTFINRDTTKKNNDPSIQELRNILEPSFTNISEVIGDSERFKELCPEIADAANILVSCILAPNDLTQSNISFDIDDSTLDAPVLKNVIKFIEDYFNDEYKLSEKLYQWCNESLFRSGAQPIVIIPERTIASMFETDVDRVAQKDGAYISGKEEMNNFNKPFKKKIKPETLDIDIEKKKTPYSEMHMVSIGKESKEFKDKYEKDLTTKLKVATENLLPELIKKYHYTEKAEPTVEKGLEAVAVNLRARIEEGDILHISENPSILRFGKKQKDNAMNNIASTSYAILGGGRLDDNNNKYREFISLLQFAGKNTGESKDRPLIMSWPAASLIPISVPGSKDEHMGYFGLLDEFGYPLEPDLDLGKMTDCSKGKATKAYSSLFGNNASKSDYEQFLISGGVTKGKSFNLRNSALASVFDTVLDTMLKHKLENVGLGRVNIGQHQNIARCMLYRFFEKQKTTLVYIPKEFVTYFCFDYRNDGTGLSIIETIKTVLSIRATLLVAGMLSAANASIPHRSFKYQADEKDRDWENTYQLLQEMIKAKYGGNINYLVPEILHNIADQHVTTSITGINGKASFEIEKSETQSQAMNIDTTLMDTLNNMITSHLGIPPALLSQMKDIEFARAITTSNIYFANKIALKQSRVITRGTEHIQTILRNDPFLLKGIFELIKGSNKKSVQELPTESTKDGGNVLTESNSDGSDNPLDAVSIPEQSTWVKVFTVVNKIRMTLPSPRVAADKTQFEEARALTELLNTVIETAFNRELVSDDPDLTDTMTTVISFVKQKVFEEVLQSIGSLSSFKIPTLEDIATIFDKDLRSNGEMLRNIREGLKQAKLLQTTDTSDADAMTEGDTIDGSGAMTADDSGGSSDDSSGGDDYTKFFKANV